MASVTQPVRTPTTSRTTALILATLSQAGITFAHQGVVVVGIFFVVAYHLTLSQMGIVVSFVSLGWMCSGLVTGLLVDRLGPRIVLFFGTLWMSSAATLIALTGNLVFICVLLFVLGLGVSTISLAGTVTVLTSWSRAKRGLPMGIRQMGVPVGSMIAAIVLPTLAALYGLSALFGIFAIEIFVLGMAFCLVLPSAPRSVVSQPHPTVGLWRDLRQIALPCFAGSLLAWGQYMLLTFTIPMLHGQGGLSVALAGGVLAVAQLGGGIARISLGAVSDRLHGRRDLVLIATAATATALAVLIALLPTRLPLPLVLLLWLLLGAAMVGWNALIVTWSGERVQQANAGAAMGLTTSCVLFGAIISAPVLGLIIQSTGKFANGWLALAAILLLATVVLLVGARRTPAPSELPPETAALANS